MGTPSRLAKAAALPIKPSVSMIEKAYIQSDDEFGDASVLLKEGMRRGEAKRAEQNARITELIIRLKTAKGELIRRNLRG